MREHRIDRSAAMKRHLAAHELVRHHAERVDIGARIDEIRGARLHRRHVHRRAEHRAGHRAIDSRRREQLREPPIQQANLGPAAGHVQHEDVVRLEIAMHDALAVRRDQRRCDLVDDRRGLAHV